MPGKCNAWVLNMGLTQLQLLADKIFICSQEPVDYASATTTYALGNMAFGAGLALTGPTARTPNGSKVTTVAVTNGAVTGTGNATRWAIVDSVNSRLLVDNDLASAQGVTAGNVWSLPAFDFGIPGS